ncbi:hypothetical protein MYX84_03860 [Acidobacteria bacterium AH-259-O06]|nr:hypothetical protein [Acidobacteria bacterium AH-259-O06]
MYRHATGGLSLRASHAEELAGRLNRALETVVEAASLKVTVLDADGNLALLPKIFIQDPEDESRSLAANYAAEGRENPYSVLLPSGKFNVCVVRS